MGAGIALGATRLEILWLILKEASLPAGIGLGIGLVGSVLAGRTLRTTLYGVAALDFSVTGSVGVILLLAALLASYLPARRAASIDPMQALRTDKAHPDSAYRKTEVQMQRCGNCCRLVGPSGNNLIVKQAQPNFLPQGSPHCPLPAPAAPKGRPFQGTMSRVAIS